MNHQFATKLEDLEPSFMLGTNETNFLTQEEIPNMIRACKKENVDFVAVIDCEGQNVCFAPVSVASRIIFLLNQDAKTSQNLYGN